MKIKTFSKIIALVITAILTVSLTSCKEEQDVPVYGTGIVSDTGDTGVHHQIVTKPVSDDESEVTQGADFMLVNAVIEQGSDGKEYLVLYTGVTNLTNEEKILTETVSVKCQLPSGIGLSYCRDTLRDYTEDNLYQMITPGEQSLVVYAMLLPNIELDYIILTVEDQHSQEIIFETNIYLETEE